MTTTSQMAFAWSQVAKALTDEDGEREVADLVNFAAGWLLGGDQTYGACVLIGLAEMQYGNPPWLVQLKYKVGLAGEASHLT